MTEGSAGSTALEKIMAATENHSEVALYCATGSVQYASSIEAMLEVYNRKGRFYEIRKDEEGRQILWHKGHKYSAGFFGPSLKKEK